MEQVAPAQSGFNPGTESAYRLRREAQVTPFERLGAVAGAASFLVMIVWDHAVAPEFAARVMPIRLGVAAVLVVGLLPITFTRAGRNHLLVQVAAFTVVLGGFSWVLAVLPDGFDIGLAGLTIGVVLIPLVAIERSHVAVLGALALVVANVAMAASNEPRQTFTNVNTWIVLSLAFAAGVWFVFDRVNRRLFLTERELDAERRRADDLLESILPRAVADRLKLSRETVSDRFESVTILFSDLVGFTAFSKTREPDVVVGLLNDLFSRFDENAERLGVEKIKTIGDGYMAAGGVPSALPDHAARVSELALAMLDVMDDFRAVHGVDWQIRIGVHTGTVVAGVIGKRKFAYDLWGDAVNVASRLESTSAPGRIHVSADTVALLPDSFEAEGRGVIDLRNRGELPTFFLNRKQPSPITPAAASSS
jgi:class 3 adenylate cyclase